MVRLLASQLLESNLSYQRTANLLSIREQQLYYQAPNWTAIQRTEAFTFTAEQIKQLRCYKLSSGIYFAITLVFFQTQHTLINFNFAKRLSEIEHVIQRYYPKHDLNETELIISQKTKTRIENKVLQLCGYHRCRGAVITGLKEKLKKVASRYPKQRGLCKAIIDICLYEKIVIPSLPTMEKLTREIWRIEQKRLIATYKWQTNKQQRKELLSLLEKADQFSLIVLLRQEMKGYTTEQIEKTLKQHKLLSTLFSIAKAVLPKLKLPTKTIDYYASLVNYYSGTQLASLEHEMVEIYLLCYCFLRFQQINDHLLEAFKKRALSFYTKSKAIAESNASEGLTQLENIRKNVSNMLLAIKKTAHKDHVPKSVLFNYVPEADLETTAKLLVDDKLDPAFLFWKEIDKQSGSIKLNLRPLFLTLEITITHHNALSNTVDFVRKLLKEEKTPKANEIPEAIINWLSEKNRKYIIEDEQCHFHRLEFWLYYQLAQQIKSNKLTLQHTIKYKLLEDDLLPNKDWKKQKGKILKSLPYSKLKTKPKSLITELKKPINSYSKRPTIKCRMDITRILLFPKMRVNLRGE